MVGLGLCWASEELVTFCVAGLQTGDTSMYLYAAYLPFLALSGAVFVFLPAADRLLAGRFTKALALAFGVLGVLLLALFPSRVAVVVGGIALYATGASIVNIPWMRAFSVMPVRDVRRSVVATAVITTVALILWSFDNAGILFAAAVLFSLGLGAYGLWHADAPKSMGEPRGQTVVEERGMRSLATPLGACIIMMSFGFLQYGAYHYGSIEPEAREFVSHFLAVALVAAAVYGVRDGEFTFGFKMATTLMLFSFVLRAVLPSDTDLAVTLAAATEGMLELVMLLLLVELVRARRLLPARVFGGYLVIVSLTQLAGCGLSVLEHAIAPSVSYSVVGLAFVALLIIAAVWLLNDKTVTAFLWEGRGESGQREGAATPAVEQPFDERARAVAVAFGLTARETEVMQLFAKGRSSSFIAESFCVSNNTVRSHILHLYSKCDVHSRQELITLIDDWSPEEE